MSLTNILNYSNKDFKDFRNLLKERFPTPKFKCEANIKTGLLTTDYMLVGMAYDYLLRFKLERKYKAKVFGGKWAAESALRFFSKRHGFALHSSRSINDLSSQQFLNYFEERRAIEEKVPGRFKECKSIYEHYLRSVSKATDQVYEAVLFLAKLDSIYRLGPIMKQHIDFRPENPINITELKRLDKACSLELFKPKRKIVLNPTFGKGSKLVGGAEADLIVDDLLLDIKVTQIPKLTRPFFNQLIGYYLLYMIGGIDKHKDIEVKRIGIYFARHDVIWGTNVHEIAKAEEFKKAVAYLTKKINKI